MLFSSQNEASCIDGVNEYSCKCNGDYSGKFCELGPAAYQQTSPCQQNDCQNGICFVPPNSNDYVCKCSPGFSGKSYIMKLVIYIGGWRPEQIF